MTERVVIEFVIGLLVGVAFCLGKEFLMQRYFMRSNALITMLLFVGRLVVDVVIMIIAAKISIFALIGAALGLSAYVNYVLIKTICGSKPPKSNIIQ